ncbi:MAG: universal stress protein [Comamonas sp.]
MSIYQQILVAVDGSAASEKALDEAIRIARLTGARMRLIHVVNEVNYAVGLEPVLCYVDEIIPMMRAAGKELLEKCQQKAQAHGVSADTVLVEGGISRIYEHVAEQARRAHADLIVVGSHGRRGVGRVLLGSDAELIIRHAPVPVLVVRAGNAPVGPHQAPG